MLKVIIIRIMLKWVFWLVLPIPLKRRGGRFVTQNGVGRKSRTRTLLTQMTMRESNWDSVTSLMKCGWVELGLVHLAPQRGSSAGSVRERVERGLCHLTAGVGERKPYENLVDSLSPFGLPFGDVWLETVISELLSPIGRRSTFLVRRSTRIMQR